MTPFHPKLRQALLRHPKHQQTGLTGTLLLRYEGLVNQVFHEVYYPPLPAVDHFKITHETLQKVITRHPDIPPEIVEKLAGIRGREYTSEASFKGALRKLLGKEEKKYTAVLLEYADQTVYCLGQTALEKLSAENLPEEILASLRRVQYQTARGKGNFNNLLARQIGKDQLKKYQPRVLAAAGKFDALDEVIRFRKKYMPEFDPIYRQWVASQKRGIDKSYLDLNIGRLLLNSLKILKSIIVFPILYSKKPPRYAKIG